MPTLGAAVQRLTGLALDPFLVEKLDQGGLELSRGTRSYAEARLFRYKVTNASQVIDEALKLVEASGGERLIVAEAVSDVGGGTTSNPQATETGGKKCCGQGPGVITKAINYGLSTVKWRAAGSPMRTDEQVNEIAKICYDCERFQNDTCLECGCPILNAQNEKKPKRNKLRLATEECPLGKWGVQASANE